MLTDTEGSFASNMLEAVAREMHGGALFAPKTDVARPFSPPPKRKLYVINRRGEEVTPRFDEITKRIEELCGDPKYGPPLPTIDAPLITQKVVEEFHNRNGMTTREIDSIVVRVCLGYSTHSGEWLALAARVCVSDLHKRMAPGLNSTLESLRKASPRTDDRIHLETLGIIKRFQKEIDARLRHERDYRFKIFGFQTIARSYLLRSGDRLEEDTLLDDMLLERPQHWYMRQALGIKMGQPDRQGHLAEEKVARKRLEEAFEHYDRLSLHKGSHASPTQLNIGMKTQQLSSCFKLAPGDDMDSLLDTVKYAGQISKCAGGESIWLHAIRAEGARIRGTGGTSEGIRGYLQILEKVQMYVNQGGNRPGAFAVQLEIWHADIITFVEMARLKDVKVNAPKLKYALWVPTLFVQTLREDGDWYLMCPAECEGLHRVWGAEFNKLYLKYVAEGKYKQKIKAQELLRMVWMTLIQVGTPYLALKDNFNSKSNLQNVATICSSNLCHEISIPSFSDYEAEKFGAEPGKGEFGVCNLAALCLASYIVDDENGLRFDFKELIDNADAFTVALDQIIDINYSPTPQCERSNKRHRPLGLGIMGWDDVRLRFGLNFGSPEHLALGRAIGAAIYYGALRASTRRGRELGAYPSFGFNGGCPMSRGLLQPDLWVKDGHLSPNWEEEVEPLLGQFISRRDWQDRREDLKRGWCRNSEFIAYMPTATTSQIVGQNECFEPYTTQLYPRQTLAGTFVIPNEHLQRDLRARDLWDDDMRRALIGSGGSVQEIKRIPDDLKKLYRTARELNQRLLLLNAKAFAPFVDQSMSLNFYHSDLTLTAVWTLLDMAEREGLKTAWYYMHTLAAAGGQQSSIMKPTEKKRESASDVVRKAKTIVHTKNGVAPMNGHEKMRIEEPVAPMCSLKDRNCTSCSV